MCKKHHWEGESPNPKKYFGFVYVVYDYLNKKYYIGKKHYRIHRKLKVKGRKSRRSYITESNWRYYTGSNKKLNSEIEKYGLNKFRFIILKQYETRGGLAYGEVEAIIINRALYKPYYYNGQIDKIRFKPTEVISNINKLKVKEIFHK